MHLAQFINQPRKKSEYSNQDERHNSESGTILASDRVT